VMVDAMLRAALVLGVVCGATAISAGDKIPSSLTLDHGFPPDKILLAERVKHKNVIIVGLPGAFTPT